MVAIKEPTYNELVRLKGQRIQESLENKTLGDVIDELLSFYNNQLGGKKF